MHVMCVSRDEVDHPELNSRNLEFSESESKSDVQCAEARFMLFVLFVFDRATVV